MKSLLPLVLLVFFSLNALASQKSMHYCRPLNTNLACEMQIALTCGAGYIDGCFIGQTKVHKCVLRNEGPDCNADIEILCPDLFRDGCETGKSAHHQCIPEVGPSCVEEAICPIGFQDDCH